MTDEVRVSYPSSSSTHYHQSNFTTSNLHEKHYTQTFAMKFSLLTFVFAFGTAIAAPTPTKREYSAEVQDAAKNLIDVISDLDYYKRAVTKRAEYSTDVQDAAKNLIDVISDLDYYKRSETKDSAELMAAVQNMINYVSGAEYDASFGPEACASGQEAATILLDGIASS
ncbi:hypothetical protein VM1G_04720 [Cytospora mali]|uniref:Uncharacterized protein n=1 Tax=Cytospora mali TaxID=578113 RepID=A0A194VZW2_CYTMA|nr:hypothetical protein VM1G_04720 [Valsa mali]